MPNITDRYPEEDLTGLPPRASKYAEPEDDGTMTENVHTLRDAVVGHRIVKAETRSVTYYLYGDDRRYDRTETGLVLTLDDGREVALLDTDDCCAYTSLNSFLHNPEMVDHVITGVGTEDGFTTWHIYADMGDVLKLDVGWSSGNPFYYAYGFNIRVLYPGDDVVVSEVSS